MYIRSNVNKAIFFSVCQELWWNFDNLMRWGWWGAKRVEGGGPLPFRLELRYWLEVNPKWPTVLSHWRHPIERGSKGEENRGNSSLAYLSWVDGNKTLLLISLSGPYWKGVALLIDPFWKPVAFVYYCISKEMTRFSDWPGARRIFHRWWPTGFWLVQELGRPPTTIGLISLDATLSWLYDDFSSS